MSFTKRQSRLATELASAQNEQEAARAVVAVFARLFGRPNDLVLNHVDPDTGRYRVLAGSTPNTEGLAGSIAEHPFLGAFPDLNEPVVVRTRDRRCPITLRARLQAGKIRSFLILPLRDGKGTLIASLIVLRRRRLTLERLPRETSALLTHAGAGLGRFILERSIEEARARERDIQRGVQALASSVHMLDQARTSEEVVGHVLQRLRELDPALIGAVAGVVSGSVVTHVSAIGTTPRPAIHELPGTRLDGFPIGRELMANRAPIIAGLSDVSHATRTKIMEPLGAQSLLAAAGRAHDIVRIVVSAYRSSVDPPQPWLLRTIEILLERAGASFALLDALSWTDAIGDVIGEGIAIFDRSATITYTNQAFRRYVPECSGGEHAHFSLPAYETIDGDAVRDDEHPVARAIEGERMEGVRLRLRSTGTAHHISATPLPSGGALLTIQEIESSEASAEPVTDLSERRARRIP